MAGHRAVQRSSPRTSTTPWAVTLAAIYLLLIVAPPIVLAVLNWQVDRPPVAELGADGALVAFTILSLQFVLTARFRWIEAPFGLDLLLVFHRVMALIAAGLLVAHPFLIAWGEGWALLTGLHARWYIWAGRAALAMLLLHIGIALSRRALRLSYERWRTLHNVLAVMILTAGVAHSLAAGGDLQEARSRLLWCLLPAAGLVAWVYCRLIRPRLLARRAFRVLSIVPEAPRVWTLTLESPADRTLRFLPGQFQFLSLPDSQMPHEEHPFTIASSPTRPEQISLTIRSSGDFTAALSRVRPGDRATVHGPFGRFSHDLYPSERELVFVAGGVGITPLMSMLRAMQDRGDSRRVTLVHATRSVHDLLFAGELAAMEAGGHPFLQIVQVLSDPPDWWKGRTGRIDADRLRDWCAGFEGKAFYLCCPPQMTCDLISRMRQKGVSPRRIHCDYFSL